MTNLPEEPELSLNRSPKAVLWSRIDCARLELADQLTTKANLYARAEIIEYWVINAVEQKLHIHRHPLNGIYHGVSVHSEVEEVVALAAPETPVHASELFPRNPPK